MCYVNNGNFTLKHGLILYTFAEGYLTSCTFDYLTETFEIKAFVAVIFVYAWVIPVSLTILFYSKIVSHVSEHEKLLREQVIRLSIDFYLLINGMGRFAEHTCQETILHRSACNLTDKSHIRVFVSLMRCHSSALSTLNEFRCGLQTVPS
jgi:hypothetical protein